MWLLLIGMLATVHVSDAITETLLKSQLRLKPSNMQQHRTKRNSIKGIRARYYNSVYPGGPGQQKIRRLTRLIAMYIAKGAHSIDTVEEEGFIDIFKEIYGEKFVLPSSTTISRILEKLGQQGRKEVASLLENREVCLTGDLATVMSNTKGFLVLSLHHLDDKGVPKSITLGCKYLPSRHTGLNIGLKIEECLEDFGIVKKQIIGACTDGGQNMINGMKSVLFDPDTHNICMCHFFATMVRHVMKKLDTRFKCLDKIQSHAYHLKMSSVSMEDFRESQYDDGATESSAKKLKTSVITRWNSAYLSAVAYIELKDHANFAASQDHYTGPAPLTNEDVQTLEDYIGIMKPLYDATNELSGELYLTGSSVVPVFAFVIEKVEGFTPKTETGLNLRDELLMECRSKFDVVLKNSNFLLACFLDPRYKLEFFESLQCSSSTVEKVNLLLRTQPLAERRSMPDDSIFKNSKYDAPRETGNNTASTYHSELRHYLNMPLASANTDPTKFWLSNETVYPTLQPLALKLLLTPASSVASERIVSHLNVVVSDRRSRLVGKTIDNLVFLKCLDDGICKKIVYL